MVINFNAFFYFYDDNNCLQRGSPVWGKNEYIQESNRVYTQALLYLHKR